MKKKSIFIWSVVIIFVVLVFVYKQKPKEKVKIDLQPSGQVVIEGLIVPDSYETKVLNPNNAYVKFDVKYPYFKKANADFNSSIETLIKTQVDEDAKISAENWQARYDTQAPGDNIPKVPKTDDDKFTFTADFTIIQSNSSYVSFVQNYGGFTGGAHGYETNVSFNYDVKKQQVVNLGDLFPDDPEYLTKLSTKSREYLKKQFATVSEEDKKNSTPEAIKEYVDNIVSMIDAGTEPKKDNFSVFTFNPDKITIYFAQYQVGPYAIGMPEIEINRE